MSDQFSSLDNYVCVLHSTMMPGPPLPPQYGDRSGMRPLLTGRGCGDPGTCTYLIVKLSDELGKAVEDF